MSKMMKKCVRCFIGILMMSLSTKFDWSFFIVVVDIISLSKWYFRKVVPV